MRKKFILTLYLSFMLIPLLGGLIYCLLYSMGGIGLLSKGFTLKVWFSVLSSELVMKSFLSSILVATISLSLSVILALFIVLKFDWLINSRLANLLLQIPLSFPPMIAAFLMFQFLYKGGILSRLSFQTGLTNEWRQFPELVNDVNNIGVILTMIILATPFFVVFYLQKIKSLGIRNFVVLAQSLGASYLQTNSKIVIPILLKESWLNIALYWLILFGNFEIPLILGIQNPSAISVLISQKLTKYDLNELPQAYAISMLYILIVITVFLIFIFKRLKTRAA